MNTGNRNTPSRHHPWRRNVTTYVVGLKKTITYAKITPKRVNPRVSWEHWRSRWIQSTSKLKLKAVLTLQRIIAELKGLTLCRAQRPKMSARGRGQNVPKRPVAIGQLRCFQTRKFPYNLARISWIITVQDFRYFLPRHLHCLCVQSESKRVFESRVEETRCWFSRQVFLTISDNDEQFYGFHAEDIVLREAVADLDFNVTEVCSVHSSDWSKWKQWWFGRRYRDRNGWSRRTRPIDDRFTVRNRRKN